MQRSGNGAAARGLLQRAAMNAPFSRTKSLALGLSLSLFASLGLLGVVACSSGSGGGITNAAPVAANQLGQAYATQVCGAIKGCCTDNGFGDDWKTCNDSAAALQASFDQTMAKSPGAVYDAQKAGNCIARFATAIAQSCGNDQAIDTLDNDADCQNFFAGTKAPGETCSSSADCSPGAGVAYCRLSITTTTDDAGVTSSGSSSTGVCLSMKMPAAGDPCLSYASGSPDVSKTYADCERDPNLFCNSTTNTCTALVAIGETCFSESSDGGLGYTFLQCAKGATCDTQSTKCVAAPAVGEACTGTCGTGAYCDNATMKCVAQKQPGDACTNADQSCVHGCDKQSGKCRKNEVSRDTCAGNVN